MTAEDAQRLEDMQTNGFIKILSLMDDETLQKLRHMYDRFVSGEISAGKDNRQLGGQIHQIMNPSQYEPYFQDNPALTRAKELAAPLLGKNPEDVFVAFDMLIDKPAGSTKETPWHQDLAYNEMPMAPAGTQVSATSAIQVWVALDDVDIDNGCMQFVAGKHAEPLLAHYVAGGNPQQGNRLLATHEIDASQAVAVPLAAGGCTMHHENTPHYTGPNVTQDRRRRAYIFNLR